MDRYNALCNPEPADWLALDEGERHVLVEDFHRKTHIAMPNLRLHAVIHAVVETQIAEGGGIPTRDTLARLMKEGLDRHEAVHAIGSVLAEFLHEMMTATTDNDGDPNPKYFSRLEGLRARDWLSPDG